VQDQAAPIEAKLSESKARAPRRWATVNPMRKCFALSNSGPRRGSFTRPADIHRLTFVRTQSSSCGLSRFIDHVCKKKIVRRASIRNIGAGNGGLYPVLQRHNPVLDHAKRPMSFGLMIERIKY